MNNALKSITSISNLLESKGLLFGSRAYGESYTENSDYNYFLPESCKLELESYLRAIPREITNGISNVDVIKYKFTLGYEHSVVVVPDDVFEYYVTTVTNMMALPNILLPNRLMRTAVFEHLIKAHMRTGGVYITFNHDE